jgi:hypothetical protein
VKAALTGGGTAAAVGEPRSAAVERLGGAARLVSSSPRLAAASASSPMPISR